MILTVKEILDQVGAVVISKKEFTELQAKLDRLAEIDAALNKPAEH